MKPLAWIFGAGVGLRNSLYSHGLLKQHRLRGRTISIGNLSVGGSGKTPFVLLLGDLLRSRRLSFDVLSRGYGRRSKGVLEVDSGGSAQDFGDEPLLISRKLAVPVILGEDRYQAGVFTEEKFAPHMHLLDDGFQHRALARDFDIVLVTAEDARDSLLPAGQLREPLSSLSRADAVVLTSGASTDSFPLDGKQVWRVRRGISLPIVPDRAVAFCGIARPKSFFLQLQKAGVDVVAEAVYRDHHSYTERDIRELLALKKNSEATGFVTTEKDAINLGGYLSALQPLAMASVTMELIDATNAIDTMLRIIEERRQRT